MSKALEVTNVEKVYGGMFGNATRALDGVSFSIGRGEYVAIMGPSGSGKTTLLNCIATIDRPTAGSVLIDGTNVTHMRAKQLSTFRREQLGFIFQDSNLLDTLTCRENVALPLTIARVAPAQIDERVERISATLGVREVLDKFPYQASGGQRQRIAVARAMLKDAPVLVLDEATSALDTKAERSVQAGLDALMADRTSVIIAHRLSTIAGVDRIITLRNGHVDEIGTPAELAVSGGIYAELLSLQNAGSKAAKKLLARYDITG